MHLGRLARSCALPLGLVLSTAVTGCGSRVLDAPLVVEDVGGIATVIQDELRNTYQLRSTG